MPKKAVSIFAISAGVVIALALCMSIAVDPYGLYRAGYRAGVNQQKEGIRNKIRLVKALEAPLRRPRTILLGSSRVHDGINPSNALLQDRGPVYNMAIDMARIFEVRRFLEHAIANAPVERVLIGLDLFMFDSRQLVNVDFDEALVGRPVRRIDYLPTMLSYSALQDSFRTVKVSFSEQNRREFLPNGYRPQAFFGLSDYRAAHNYTNWIFLTPKPPGDRRYYNGFTLGEAGLLELESIMKLCKQRGLDLRLFINPAHALLDGEGIFVLEKYDLFELWKRRLAEISGRLGFPIWDFSGYNSVTTEAVRNPMSNYWDSSHYKEQIGDWILEVVLGKHSTAPPDFGVLLRAETIDAHLTGIRNDRARYVSGNDEVIRAQNAFSAIRRGAPLDQVQAGSGVRPIQR